MISALAKEIAHPSFTLSPLRIRNVSGMTVCEPSTPEDLVALRATDHYLRRIYKVRQSDRNRIVRQLKIVLEDSSHLALRKLDIRTFYESIDCDAVLEDLKKDMILGFKGIRILESLFQRAEESGIAGLPRGICVSATLSERVGRDIDRHIRNTAGVYYAARYVDDIVLVTEAAKSDSIEASLDELLRGMGFTVNPDKRLAADLDSGPIFSYLGYEFSVESVGKPGSSRQVSVWIAPPKLKKQKTRICRAFSQFAVDGSFGLLIARLRYLACSQLIARTGNGLLMSGNAYNYCEVTDTSCLDTLDSLVRRIVSGQGRVGRLVAPQLTRSQIAALRRISFRNAFERRLQVQFTRSRAKRIAGAFRNA